MPPSQTSRNAHLSSLHNHLSASIDMHELREMGWFDFMRFDAKPNCSAARLAEDAFCTLSFEAGHWRRDERVLSAVLSFLDEKTLIAAQTVELKKLRVILESSQPDDGAVRAWFMRNYP